MEGKRRGVGQWMEGKRRVVETVDGRKEKGSGDSGKSP